MPVIEETRTAINVVLVEPEIPPNTGNVARTCAVAGASLHLVHPLGFDASDARARRAGLDYWQDVPIVHHASLDSFLAQVPMSRVVLFSTKATIGYHEFCYPPEVFLVFGKETAGLPRDLIAAHSDRAARIPMLPAQRSLNLSNSVAIVVYELLRRTGFPGMR